MSSFIRKAVFSRKADHHMFLDAPPECLQQANRIDFFSRIPAAGIAQTTSRHGKGLRTPARF